MKILSLVYSRFRQYIKSNKFIFLIYLSVSLLCGVCLLYLYGNFTFMMRQRNDQMAEMRQYRLYFAEDQLPSFEQVTEAVTDWEIPLACCDVWTTDSSLLARVQAVLCGHTPYYKLYGEIHLNDKGDENVAVIPAGPTLKGTDSEKGIVTLQGQEMQVIGQFSWVGYQIPLSVYQRLKYPIDGIVFTLQNKPDAHTDRAVLSRLQNQFPGAEVYGPEIYTEAAQGRLPMELLLICLVYAVSLFSFAYLLKYLLDQHIPENVVYSLIGASKKTVVRLIVLENFLLSSLSAVLSIGLHLLLKESVLDRMSISAQLTYQFSDYLLLFLLMVAVSQLVSLPFILRYWKQTAAVTRSHFV